MAFFKQQDKFNFFVPLSFEKGKDGESKYLMKIKGIASYLSEDSDGETLYPSGYDLQPLLDSGFINWNHKANQTSAAICGKPTAARIIEKGKALELEGVVYNNTEGRSVAELIELLEDEPDRQIGWSIEGVATERDLFNPKKILKARLTGVALTHMPKNGNTFVSIVKGEYAEPFIVGVVDEDTDEKEKSMDLEGMAPAIPESVEHDPKDINNKFGSIINKSEIYIQIAKRYPASTTAQLKSTFSFVEAVNSKLWNMAENKISEDAIKKAFEILDQVSLKDNSNESNPPVQTTDVINKADDSASLDETEVEKAMGSASLLLKAGYDKDKACDTMVKGGIALNVAQASWEKALSEMQAQQNGDQNPEPTSIMKAEEVEAIVSGQFEQKFNPAFTSLKQTISEGFNSVNLIIKSLQETNQSLTQKNEELNEKIELIAKGGVPRKSVTNIQAVERFEKAQDSGEFKGETFNVTSKQDLEKLTDRLFAANEQEIQKSGKSDPLLEGAIMSIESQNLVPEFAYARLASMNIRLVKPS